MNTHKFCFKCRKCALEYAVYSYYPERWVDKKPFCPECGEPSEDNQTFLMHHEDVASMPKIIYDKGIM